MPRGLFNWCFRDVTRFLKANGFEFKGYLKGSHESWVNKSTNATVEINFHGNKSYPPRTLETMIRQSKIDKKKWRKLAQ